MCFYVCLLELIDRDMFGGVRWTVRIDCWDGNDLSVREGGDSRHNSMKCIVAAHFYKCHHSQQVEDNSPRNGNK